MIVSLCCLLWLVSASWQDELYPDVPEQSAARALFVACHVFRKDVSDVKELVNRLGISDQGHSVDQVEKLAQELGLHTYRLERDVDLVKRLRGRFLGLARRKSGHWLVVAGLASDGRNLWGLEGLSFHTISFMDFQESFEGPMVLVSSEPVRLVADWAGWLRRLLIAVAAVCGGGLLVWGGFYVRRRWRG
ncbi:MAG: hypothetical protein KatS3mg110_0645 [Pirellulaceae bacterium]|nr:MAG: hypothetical protein KatS3mg110_0645 [Pirellulaceae bacterium]